MDVPPPENIITAAHLPLALQFSSLAPSSTYVPNAGPSVGDQPLHALSLPGNYDIV
jgi:hypothetical protein